MTSFSDRLTQQIRHFATPLCVGLDPFEHEIPHLFGPIGALSTLEAFCQEVIEQVISKVAVIKPQIGLFEPWGGEGIALLAQLSRYARDRGLLVIIDAKRGDIGSTAQGYAKTFLGQDAAIPCDCLTINPYLGLDSLEPFVTTAMAYNKGVAILVRTSNPGAVDFQDLMCGHAPLWMRVGEALVGLQAQMMGQGNYSSLMVVCGATWPEEAVKLRHVLPKTLFLVPGYGAQGATAGNALAGLIKGPKGHEGGVISSSRAILYPRACKEATSLAQWRQVFQVNLEMIIHDLHRASDNVVPIKQNTSD
ncbi:orotidine-5'-phosphate decarboxylase [Candidatus Phycosocius spiralis]|uniref:Orotidine 5'-phosphate decarboxylase n=1 Tax=Candidatus Phycosocius spiralis TaxID=2815099 RepID=A0ABQ4PXH8_9PROT|nr:orotidine-5'-phosphate decarboxylase [Candidatus Phycosocius spiralis]GIU67656.1 orotidine 5'-phosphate decarboxylase [Candidatus Phycosocius spiralis]